MTVFLASLSSPDVKMTVFGLFDEKSCIQAIGILLIDFTSLAPGAISAIISLEMRPFKAAIDLFTPLGLTSVLESIWALVASIRISPMPVDILECLGHVHPIRGEDDDIAFSGLPLRTSRLAWAEIGDEACQRLRPSRI